MICKNCGSEAKIVVADLGFAPPSNSFLSKIDLNEGETYFPLKVFLCEQCLLVQMDEYKNAKEIFAKNYVYFSSYSKTWVQHAKDYVDMISTKLKLNTSSQVIEIASNDGYLLQFFNRKSIPNFGIEPTSSTASAARAKGINVIEYFFNSQLAKNLPKADLIIGNNVIAHVPDIRDFVQGVYLTLKENGMATFEFPHILNMLQFNQFDTIYHEHFYYYSLHAIINLFEAEKLHICDVDMLSTHGGSLRIYASKNKMKQSKMVEKVLKLEKTHSLDSPIGYANFQSSIENTKNDFLSLLLKAKKQNKKIVGFGAAAKGNTLLNYCGIKTDMIECVVDSSPYKQNLFLPGSHIPVKDKDVLSKIKPDYIWIPAWNLKSEIINEIKILTTKNVANGGGGIQIHYHFPKDQGYYSKILAPNKLIERSRYGTIFCSKD